MTGTTAPTQRVLQGDLSQIYVPRLLHYLNEAGKTGVLTLSDGDRQIQVHVRDGAVAFVSSAFLPGLALADFLAARKIVADEVLQKSAAAALRAGKRLGVYLIENGLIAPQALYETLNLQLKAKLFRAFTWVRGQYAFREGDAVEAADANLAMNLPNVIYEGLRDHVPMDKLPREFRGRKEEPLFRRPSARIEIGDLRMKSREVQMLRLVDGKRSLRDIVTQGGGENKKDAYKALYGLFVLGIVGFGEGVAARGTRAAAPRPRDEEGDEAVDPGFAVRAADDLIRKAVESVDRIRRESGRAPVRESEDAEAAAPFDFGEVVDEPGPAPRRPEDRRSPIDDETQALEMEEPIDLGPAEPDPAPPRAEANAPAIEPGPATVAPPLSADDAFQRAEFLLSKMDYAGAVPLLRQAREQKPQDPEIAPLLGWAIYNAGQGSLEAFVEAEKLLRQVTRVSAGNWRAFLYLGKIYKANNQRDFAELHFVRALELNRECVEAKEEIKNLYR